MRKNKSTWLVLALLAALSVVVQACGTESPTVSPAQPTLTTGPAGQDTGTMTSTGTPMAGTAGTLTGEISFQFFGDPAEVAIIDEVVKGFKEVQPNATVNLNNVPSQGDHMQKLSVSFSAGNPPDVWLLNYRRYGQFAASNVIEPAGPLLAKSAKLKQDMFYDEPIGAFSYGGTLQCVPQNVSSLVVYYNKDLFAKYNVPLPQPGWTWEQFLSTAQSLTKDTDGDGKRDIHGLGVPPQIIRLAPFVWQNGGEIVDNPDNPTSLALKTGPAREAVQFFMDLQLVHKVVPSEVEEKAEDLDARFMNGKLAMFMASRVATPGFREITAFDWDVAGLPQKQKQASILHSDAYCISAASKHKELAWAFVEYAMSPEGQTRVAALGRTVPSLKSVAQSPAFLESKLPPMSGQVFLDAIPQMRLVPVISTWPKIETTINEELEQAFFGLVPIDVALDRATEATTPLFAEAAKDR